MKANAFAFLFTLQFIGLSALFGQDKTRSLKEEIDGSPCSGQVETKLVFKESGTSVGGEIDWSKTSERVLKLVIVGGISTDAGGPDWSLYYDGACVDFGKLNSDLIAEKRAKGSILVTLTVPGPGDYTIRIRKLIAKGTKKSDGTDFVGEVFIQPEITYTFKAVDNAPAAPPPPPVFSAPDPVVNTGQAHEEVIVKKPNAAQPPAQPDLPSDEVAFNKAESRSGKSRVDAMQAFIEQYPASKFLPKAKSAVPTEVERISEAADADAKIQRFLLNYAIDPILDLGSVDTNNIQPLAVGGSFIAQNAAGKWVLAFRVNGPATLALTDRGKSGALAEIQPLQISGQAVGMPQVVRLQDGSYKLKLNGIVPYVVKFFKDDVYQGQLDLPQPENAPAEISINIADLRSKGGAGNYGIKVRSTSGTTEPAEGIIEVLPRPFPWLWVGGGAAVLLLGFFIFRLQKAGKRQKIEQKIKAHEQQKNQPEPVILEEAEAATVAPAAFPSSGIQITNRENRRHLSAAAFSDLLENGTYRPLQLGDLWDDTALSELYLSQKMVKELSLFLQAQQVEMLEEKRQAIREIGGFLLGKYTSEGTGVELTCRVAIERFVPIVPEDNSVYRLEFSTDSLVHELGDMQDKYPDLSLVGWFHTHPGHGLFLSKPDLMVHNGFFREKYQFAMEIDPLTENLDTAFFARNRSGVVNNQENLRPGSKWFDWTDIEKLARKR